MAVDDTQEAHTACSLIKHMHLHLDVSEAQDNLLMAKVAQATFAN
jgi:hypothetical protein